MKLEWAILKKRIKPRVGGMLVEGVMAAFQGSEVKWLNFKPQNTDVTFAEQ